MTPPSPMPMRPRFWTPSITNFWLRHCDGSTRSGTGCFIAVPKTAHMMTTVGVKWCDSDITEIMIGLIRACHFTLIIRNGQNEETVKHNHWKQPWLTVKSITRHVGMSHESTAMQKLEMKKRSKSLQQIQNSLTRLRQHTSQLTSPRNNSTDTEQLDKT